MAESEKRDVVVVGGGGGAEEEERLLEGVTVVDFDLLCSTVAMQAQGKWGKLDSNRELEDGFGGGEFGGVFRMWEGDLLDCFDDRRVALESACCPCYRFGKNMGRAGFGSCFVQGIVYFIFVAAAIFSCIAFIVTGRHCFLYLAMGFIISAGTYLGFFRTQIRKKFNIRGSDSLLDDCVYHLICPSCTLCQETRTLEMNNVQDGTWHGRGDTICIGSEASKAFFELHPPTIMSTKSPEPLSLHKVTNTSDQSRSPKVEHSVLLVPPSQ